MFWKCCSSSALFCTFLSTTIQDDCKRRTLFRVFRGHVLFEGIYFFFCIWDNRPRHFLRCRFSVLFGWTLDCHFLGRVHRIFLFSGCREWKRFYVSSRICSSVQNKEEPPAHFKKRFCLFLTLQKVTMNGFENILKWHCGKPFLHVVVLEFDDSCYADAKQYRLASFSTRNSTLNTSLRWPIRMRDFT